MLLITSPRFEEHVTPPGHPERMERAHVFDAVAARWMEKGGETLAPRAAVREELARVHGEEYLDRIAATAGRAVMLDADTFTSPESAEIALLAAGAAVQAAEYALEQRAPAFALVRPPGHHAEAHRAMGFCLYNNVAVAAAAALARGLQRVAIVDIDVHHGNGTQWMFYDDPRVLYVSTHEYPFYPGTGAADEVGRGEGAGYTVNVPLEAGATDADYDLVYRAAVLPVLDRFAPQLLLVSAGYDAHERDPLATMRLTTAGYAQVVRHLCDVAKRHGPMALATEGGYELTALAACLEASFAVLGPDPDSCAPPATGSARRARENHDRTPAPAAPRGERALEAVRAAQAGFWRGL
jgi:acetoin utilization deacetylase AcuC-like enzyme